MKTEIVECEVKRRLPEGVYYGYWGGWEVKVNHDGEEWFMKTKTGIRGFGVPVAVTVPDKGVITVVPSKGPNGARR